MTRTDAATPRGRYWPLGRLFAVWVLSSAIALAGLAVERHLAMRRSLQQEVARLAGALAQRAEQHNAHLTALAATVQAGDPAQTRLFASLVDAIRAFYPWVRDAYWQALDHDGLPQSGSGALPVPPALSLAWQRALADGRQVLPVTSDGLPGQYWLLKSLPSVRQPDYQLALEVDIARFLGEPDPFWRQPGTALQLLDPDEQRLFTLGAAVQPRWPALEYKHTLSSATQPFAVAGVWMPALGDYLPLRRAVLILLGVALALAATVSVSRLRRATRAAERRARLGEQEARIAHAARVNAMGELTSGIVHELTQPLTAILSQTQAAKRLIERTRRSPDAADRATVDELLNANEVQARRASAMLARYRDWIRRSDESAHRSERVDVGTVIDNVCFLLDAAVAGVGARLETGITSSEATIVEGDPVQLEQVLFNLVRNALDKRVSADGGPLLIRLTCRTLGQVVVLSVEDNGLALDPALAERVTEPFVSGKPDGLGLGLALSDRIVTRMGGTLSLSDSGRGGVVATVNLPLATAVSCQTDSAGAA